jgi:peptidoglycan/LPS O-acetylase OafA/YrhL
LATYYLFFPLSDITQDSFGYYHNFFCFQYFHAENGLVLGMHSLACISDMTIGAFAALMVFKDKSLLTRIEQAPKWVWAILYALVLICFLFRNEIFYHGSFLFAFNRMFMAILFALVILEQNFAQNSLFKLSRFKLISKLGTYTYGLYCLHMIGILIAAKGLAKLGWNKNVYQVVFLEGGLSLLITILLALTSYHLFESKFQKLKDKFARITKY